MPQESKVCQNCGKEYYPIHRWGSGNSKYCIDCKDIVHKRQKCLYNKNRYSLKKFLEECGSGGEVNNRTEE